MNNIVSYFLIFIVLPQDIATQQEVVLILRRLLILQNTFYYIYLFE